MSGYCLRLLQHLRHYEEVILYGNVLEVTAPEQQEIAHYLAGEYTTEAQDYPFKAPPFHPEAALWAAQTLFASAQLLLHRECRVEDLGSLLPPFAGEHTAAAQLSADLVLRFVPDVIAQLKAIDPDDGLIPLLEAHMAAWHYSGVACGFAPGNLDFAPVVTDPCLLQLYVNRVVEHKQKTLACHPALAGGVKASLGIYGSVFWPDLNPEHLSN